MEKNELICNCGDITRVSIYIEDKFGRSCCYVCRNPYSIDINEERLKIRNEMEKKHKENILKAKVEAERIEKEKIPKDVLEEWNFLETKIMIWCDSRCNNKNIIHDSLIDLKPQLESIMNKIKNNPIIYDKWLKYDVLIQEKIETLSLSI